jgi:predicted nucleic acid-binding Zn ribbon protein
MVAGPALARASTAVWSNAGTLYVRAQSDAWRKELRRASPILMSRLGDLLGKDVIRRIEVC